jgi:hypothetical protein
MMSDTIWISSAPANPSNLRPLRHSFSGDDQVKNAIAWGNRNMAGEPMKAEFFPSEIYGAPHARESNYRLPNLFFAGSIWAVSKAAVDVLRQFDLGAAGLYPVKVFKKDRQTPVGGEWFCINFGNRKETVAVRESILRDERWIRPGVKGWIAKAGIKDGDIAVFKAACPGPDIWIDPQIGDAFFLSDALAVALKKAKADKGFFLHKCRVL